MSGRPGGDTTPGGGRMRPYVGVSTDLSPVSAVLRGRGYDVVDLPTGAVEHAHGLDAIVVSGESQGMLGMWRTEPPVPVVDADGKTPDEVAAAIEAVLGVRG
jgi:hypothetical protein